MTTYSILHLAYGIYHFVSAKHLHRYCTEFGCRHNRRDLCGIEKCDGTLLGADNKRLDYHNLIGRLTNRQLDALANKYKKNTPASPDALLDNINPDNAPIAD